MTIFVKNLGVVVRIHRRPELLRKIFSQICRLAPKRKRTAHVVFMFDRPSQEVIREVSRISLGAPEHFIVSHTESPVEVLSEKGQRWGEALEHGFAHCEDCDAGMLWDDDCVFDDLALQELRAHMDFLAYDRIEVRWKHLWNDEKTHNCTFPDHWAACLFRRFPDDTFSKRIVAHCPEKMAFSEKMKRLRGSVLHYGYMLPEDRDRAFLSYKSGGKLDAHSLALVKEPKLEDVNGN